jgi:hypothetical protein
MLICSRRKPFAPPAEEGLFMLSDDELRQRLRDLEAFNVERTGRQQAVPECHMSFLYRTNVILQSCGIEVPSRR